MNRENQAAIKNKLDGLSEVPGEPSANYAALWEKLDNNLHVKKRLRTSRFITRLTAAAALSGLIFLFGTRKNHNVSAFAVDADLNRVDLFKGGSLQKNESDSIAIVSFSKAPKSNSNIPKSIPAEKRIVQIQSPGDTSFAAVITTKPPADTIQTSPGHPTSPRKLTVVHLGELDEEDRLVSKNISALRSFQKDKNAAKKQTAGTRQFRIYLKN